MPIATNDSLIFNQDVVGITNILVLINNFTVTASGKSGTLASTYTATIKNSANVVVYLDSKSVAAFTPFSFVKTLSVAGTYSLSITGTDGTDFHTSFPVPNE